MRRHSASIATPSPPDNNNIEGLKAELLEWWTGDLHCPSHKHRTPFITIPDMTDYERLLSDNTSVNMFLVETSCNPRPSNRAWCAVESLARQNPRAKVWYVVTSPDLWTGDALVSALLERHTNLRVVRVALAQLLAHTPLHTLYTSGTWHHNNSWPATTLSDLVRLTLLWHYGGLYADTDTICLRDLTHLRDVVGVENVHPTPPFLLPTLTTRGKMRGVFGDVLVGSAAFHFTKHNPVLHNIMEYVAANFQGDVWGVSGPEAVTAALRAACRQGWEQMQEAGGKCVGLTLLPRRAFYFFPPVDWRAFFRPAPPALNLTQVFPEAYLLHAWNKLSKQEPIHKGSLYDVAASVYCPLTRHTASITDW
ncbi:hypothetical protein Pcinc_012439 [Petrolisthes cinctipes]|uniref:Alpha 1,4-glycosyltransferase domain-containing protein n=1 Tax=Petrolisthes cinctipes TaxID=88211 RepID=A0AAE1KTK2_PETCI|nr:hypothetical protein Pcinc_012439 [Petrolisthes cinctipes]